MHAFWEWNMTALVALIPRHEVYGLEHVARSLLSVRENLAGEVA